MAGHKQAEQFSIDIAPDRLSATLTVHGDLDPSLVTEASLQAELQQADLTLQPEWNPIIREGVQQYQQAPHDSVSLTFPGTPPTHGQDGWFEWASDCDPEKRLRPAAGGEADFYSQSAFIMIAEGQYLGQLHQPTAGEVGVTVTGETVAPQPGREATVQIDKESVQLAGDGTCTALTAGVLHHENDLIRVEPCLQIRENVDFSTGHIRFNGDVVVRQGVRDLFQVQATGSIQVLGLIEAAHISTGLDLEADGGMAGREKGTVAIGRDMHARHISGVNGRIHRHLVVEREIVNCHLAVGGEIQAARAVLVGGSVAATGRVTVRDLGSQAGHKTILALGSAPAIEQALAQAAAMIRNIDEQLKIDEEDAFNTMTHRGGPAAEERLAESKLTQHNLKRQRTQIQSRYDALKAAFHKRRRIELLIHRTLHPGVTLLFDNQAATFKHGLNGPLMIGHKPNKPKELIVKDLSSGDQQPILELARIRVVADDDPIRQAHLTAAPPARCA